jgi:tRNA-dihydrouridine synthase
MDWAATAERLKGSLFLSSMMGWCDADFAASRARGPAMVQLGAYVTLPEHERDLYHPPVEHDALVAFMRDQFDTFRAKAKEHAGDEPVPLVSANVFPLTDDDVARTADAFVEAGGDLYELNAHGGIGNDRERGTGRMLFLPQHTPKLMRWAERLVRAGGPVIVKGRGGVIPDLTEHVRRFEQIGVHAFHINVRGDAEGEQNLDLLERIRAATGMLLLASGYVTDRASARRLFDAGADCVGIAQAAIDDPDVLRKCVVEG